MDNKTRIAKLKENEYQEIFEVKKPTFEAMLTILEEEYEELHKQGGRPPKLKVLDRLLITLGYYREYRTIQLLLLTIMSPKSESATLLSGLKIPVTLPCRRSVNLQRVIQR